MNKQERIKRLVRSLPLGKKIYANELSRILNLTTPEVTIYLPTTPGLRYLGHVQDGPNWEVVKI